MEVSSTQVRQFRVQIELLEGAFGRHQSELLFKYFCEMDSSMFHTVCTWAGVAIKSYIMWVSIDEHYSTCMKTLHEMMCQMIQISYDLGYI